MDLPTTGRVSRRRPWPRTAKVSVAALGIIFAAVAAWKGSQDNTATIKSAGTAVVTSTSTSRMDAPVTVASAPDQTTGPMTTTGTAANRPNPELSPGIADRAVTQANIHQTICVSGYTASVRNVSPSTKNKVYAEYRITSHAPGSYEVDHLISLELGGSNDIGNLWPEPYAGPDNAHDKDTMENRLHDEVCSGQITLAQGQDEIVHWWMYERG